MPQIDQSRLILDSVGRPANGFLRVRMSRAFDTTPGFVTQSVSVATVRKGVASVDGRPLVLPPTPDGVFAQIDEDFDGETITRRTVTVPTQTSISYADLILNYPVIGGVIDGGTAGGANAGLIDGGKP